MVDKDGVMAIRGWMKLEAALANFNKYLMAEYNVTGPQLALMRMISESSDGDQSIGLSELRSSLVMHPATLGQLVDRLAKRGMVNVRKDPTDRRFRVIELTDAARRVIEDAPVAGPVRLRSGVDEKDRRRLKQLVRAFDEAVELFGLSKFTQES